VRGPLFAQRPHDRLQYVIGANQRIVIPEPHHTETRLAQIRRPLLVIGLPIRMLAAIQFHDQLLLHATEVRVIPRHGMLPAKLHAKLRRAQARPQLALGVGLVAA